MLRVLVSSFGDWAGSSANPSKGVAESLDGAPVVGASISSVIAPSIFDEMLGLVTSEIDRISPDCVIKLGEFCGRSMVTVERLAQNLFDATRDGMSAASGSHPQDVAVVEGGPAAYYSTLPKRAIVKAMRCSGAPSDLSDTAGTFGCNLLMYGVLHPIAQHNLPIRAGWIHLPSLPETAAQEANLGMPSMSLDTQIQGLRAAVAAVDANQNDINDPIRSIWQ